MYCTALDGGSIEAIIAGGTVGALILVLVITTIVIVAVLKCRKRAAPTMIEYR